MAKDKNLVKAFKAARSIHTTEFICIRLNLAKWSGQITHTQWELASAIIKFRLCQYSSVTTWLVGGCGIDHTSVYKHSREYRNLWLDSLIKEFS